MITKSLTKARAAVHFHKYYGLEFANVLAAYNAGISIFDSAAGGLGGSPNFVNSQYANTNNAYIPGAHGNCATEILIEMFRRMGVKTGIDQKKIEEAGFYAKTLSTLV
jgi:hydroxymethylglutaryl-CoA lyase